MTTASWKSVKDEKTLRTAVAKLAADLLDLASDEFSNHGCNDYKLDRLLTKAEQEAFVAFAHRWNGDPEETQDSIDHLPYFQDDFAMAVCAAFLRGER